ncbi:PLC-like phosphodiesterase [Delitschia confertaspora ATCC 74209]|uniref:PLC-like phosphodiesterase n=1 Tax=Delitschia confertaspora ATCC 74209 TaxID=1513339 RepID=A0A9P4JT93_9PLEO|nr:PLC-like phosphodiesterase [Delitschia confertaspora ATCC 74209]
MFFRILLLVGLVGALSSSPSPSSFPSIMTLSGSHSLSGADAASTPRLSDFTASILTGTMSRFASPTGTANDTASTTSSKPKSLTSLIGGTRQITPTGNSTASATTTGALPFNTQPCNNYPEFCTRKYSNITEVCAHNSPFTRKNNVGANQDFGVTRQLNDGVRMLQGQTHLVNGTLYYCHTSCDLLNAGTVESYLREVGDWVRDHPFDVITILIGNGDYEQKDADGNPLVTSKNYVEPFEKAGLMPYIYQPPKTAMTLEDWPTLSELLIKGKRVIVFIDYNFDTDAVPWMLWEFYNMWETPYSPTDINFPCTVSRPEGLSRNKSESMLYMANHNLNVKIDIAGMNLLVPNTVDLNVTNGLNGTGSLGLMANQCTSDWGRPPNFLLVDYYNAGSFNGSVFEVAARANNVTYNCKCCGEASLASGLTTPSSVVMGLVTMLAVQLML